MMDPVAVSGEQVGVLHVGSYLLMRNEPLRAQSTIIHELSHTFGLPHSWERGKAYLAGETEGYEYLGDRSGMSGMSIMSYNHSHHSLGYLPNASEGDNMNDWHRYKHSEKEYTSRLDRGFLTPEDLRFIDLWGKHYFPNYSRKHYSPDQTFRDDIDPDHHLGFWAKSETKYKSRWQSGLPLEEVTDPRRLLPIESDSMGSSGVGYELYWDGNWSGQLYYGGVRIDHEPFWTRDHAERHCTSLRKNHPDAELACFYNGLAME